MQADRNEALAAWKDGHLYAGVDELGKVTRRLGSGEGCRFETGRSLQGFSVQHVP